MAGTALEQISPAALARARTTAGMGDAEIQRTFRQAAALAQSGLFKDVTSAEKAFAKLLIGRTLGLTEAQSLSLYAMDGKIEVPYPLLATFIRSREGYDFRPAWIKSESGKALTPGEKHDREAVWLDEEDAGDMREVVGALIEFSAPKGKRGVSRWTIEDTLRAGLDKDRGAARSNHVKYPRNMFLARAMSNGIKWLVPEVAAGMPVYSEGELDRREPLGEEGAGDGSEPGWGDVPIAAVHEIEKVIRRARRLGHAGLSDRATAQMTLAGQSADVVREWIQRSHDELERLAQPEPEPDQQTQPPPAQQPVEPEEVDGEPVPVPEVEPVVATDELGPMTAEQLDREIEEATARANAAQTESEHEAAKAEVARLSQIRAGLDDAQGHLDGAEG